MDFEKWIRTIQGCCSIPELKTRFDQFLQRVEYLSAKTDHHVPFLFIKEAEHVALLAQHKLEELEASR